MFALEVEMRRHWLTLMIALVLVLTACGGDSAEDEAQPSTTTAATTEDNSSGASAPETTAAPVGEEDDDAPAGGAAPSSGASVGTLTIAGETYRFADTGFPTVQCSSAAFGVAFLSSLIQVDENGEEMLTGNLAVNVPFKGEEETAGILPDVRANLGDLEWIAGEEDAAFRGIPQGSSQVDSYEINGDTISGTATFYEENSSFGDQELVVEQGTFEVTCAG